MSLFPSDERSIAEQSLFGGMVCLDRLERGIPWWSGLVILAVVLVVPNFLATTLSRIWLGVPGLDKLAHFAAFVVVFVTLYGVGGSQVWLGRKPVKSIAAVALSLALALGDEAQQAFFDRGRTAEFADLVADAGGIFVGLTCLKVRQLGMRRAFAIVTVLAVMVAAVAFRTYQDLKHFNRGMAYEREHDYQRARAEYQLALESGIQSAELYNTVAWLDIEFLDADPTEVERLAARAFAMDPDNPDVLDTYGWVLVKSGRVQEGLTLLERAKALNPKIYCIDLHLGVAYRKLGKEEKAVNYLRAQVTQNPKDRFAEAARRELMAMGESGS